MVQQLTVPQRRSYWRHFRQVAFLFSAVLIGLVFAHWGRQMETPASLAEDYGGFGP